MPEVIMKTEPGETGVEGGWELCSLSWWVNDAESELMGRYLEQVED